MTAIHFAIEIQMKKITFFAAALAAGTVTNTWRPAAACVYRHWLLYMSAQKERRLKRAQVAMSVNGREPPCS